MPDMLNYHQKQLSAGRQLKQRKKQHEKQTLYPHRTVGRHRDNRNPRRHAASGFE
jgi:hypothetical protein